jgi:transcriptional regulator with XRE-family HTH domain
MNRRGLTIDQTARLAETSPTAIGNFLNGASNSLRIETTENLANALGISINELVGSRTWQVTRRLYLKASVATGRWNRQIEWPRKEWVEITVARDQQYADTSLFMRIETLEMNQVWPSGTWLQVVPIADYPRSLQFSQKVIVWTTNRRELIETSCREIRQGAADSCLLISRSSEPNQNYSTPFPWPIPKAPVEIDGQNVQVWGIVISSFREEI